ncbi:MAG: tetratricopeptide repeat protein [Candidatus Acidiferrales bacterium]
MRTDFFGGTAAGEAPITRIGGRLWPACLLVLLLVLLVAGAMQTRAQAPARSSFDRLTASAENGDAAAQVKLGVLYYDGLATSPRPDYAEALKWFHRAADQGNADAQDRIGIMYYYGKGVPQDYAEAAHWYQLAAQGGNYHARLQLSDMYQRGVGVPRNLQESKKWARLTNAMHPDKGTSRVRAWFAVAVLGVIAFSFGLGALQRRLVTGWQRLIVGIFVHAAGIVLVLDTLTTYGFWVVFPHCSHNFLATSCTQISNPHTRMIVNEIGDWAMANLIFRFMAGVGLVVDVLAVWYVVYLLRAIFKRPACVSLLRSLPAGRHRTWGNA